MLRKISIDDGAKMIADGKPGETYYIILDKEYVFHGNSPEKRYKIDEMNRMGLPRLSLIVPGGCVVLQKGDLIVYHYSTAADEFFAKWVKFFENKLKSRNIPFELGHELFNAKHHDFLIPKKEPQHWWKVGTHSENFAWPGLYFSCFGLVNRVNIRHIRRITDISTIKEPAGLRAWGITSEDLEIWFLEFMEETYKERPIFLDNK